MALFKFLNRGRTETVVWQPEDSDIEIAPGYAMDDDGCAGENAYGVTYFLETAPAASLTVWFYPAYASGDEDAGYEIGRHFEHQVLDGSPDPWTWSTYDAVEGWYPGLADADEAARVTAALMATAPFTGDPDSSDGGFDWDGVPW